MANRYWFARRFPVTEVNANRMGPVSTEGWMVVALFVGCMIAGAVGLFLFAFYFGVPVVGIVVMLVFGLAGGAAFLVLAGAKGDRQHTIEDYRSGRVKQ